jgi:hypothetical protein
MNTVIDADTHISEGEAMWQMLEPEFLPRRPIMLKFLAIRGMAIATPSG